MDKDSHVLDWMFREKLSKTCHTIHKCESLWCTFVFNEPIGHFTIRPSRVFETLSLSVNILTNAASATLLLCGKWNHQRFQLPFSRKTLDLAMNRFAIPLRASSISHWKPTQQFSSCWTTMQISTWRSNKFHFNFHPLFYLEECSQHFQHQVFNFSQGISIIFCLLVNALIIIRGRWCS